MKKRLFVMSLIVICAVFFSVDTYGNDSSESKPKVITPEKVDVSPPLKSIKPKMTRKSGKVREMPNYKPPFRSKRGNDKQPGEKDPSLQESSGSLKMPLPSQNFEGINNVNSVLPPDTNGDVGPNHYVQIVNISFAVYDKTGIVQFGPADINTFWTGFGGICESNNNGDPIVLYDYLADRWFISQFATNPGDYHQCIAVSVSGNPTGSWYRYDYLISTVNINDYPKFGVWPDGYYMSVNQFNGSSKAFTGVGVAAFERDKLISGDAGAKMIYFDLLAFDNTLFGLLPSDLDGSITPPSGSPNYFAMAEDTVYFGSANDRFRIFEFHADFTTPPNSTFTQTGDMNLTALGLDFDSDMCGGSRDCIPQPGTAQGVDAISDRLMYRLQYRNFGSHETLAANHTVDVDGLDHAGIRWYEVRDPGGTPFIYQAGTYAPDEHHRWMGSIAMDGTGNIAVGYSVSSDTVSPSIRYAGRLVTDPFDTLAQGEAVCMEGSGSQTSTAARWGDYSMMTVDPTDDCTFWYTQEYYETTSSADWQTRVCSFKFPECTGSPITGTGVIQGTVTDSSTNVPIVNVTIQADGINTFTDLNGFYQMDITAGTYNVTASAYSYTSESSSNITIETGTTTTQNFSLTPDGTQAVVSGTVTDGSGHGWPLYAKIDIESTDGVFSTTAYTDPLTGAYSVSLFEGEVTFTVNAVGGGYNGSVETFTVPAGGVTKDYSLTVDTTCSAPGYAFEFFEDFDSGTFPPTGWTVVDNAGSGVIWKTSIDWSVGNYTGGSGEAAACDSDKAGTLDYDTELITPSITTASLSDLNLYYLMNYQNFAAKDFLDLDISTNGGTTWTNISSLNDDHGTLRGTPGETVTHDLTSFIGSAGDFMLRWRYYDPVGNFDWYAQIDNVGIGCTTVDGGLLIGNVYDENTGNPINDAVVDDGSGNSTTSFDTPDDANLDDGFYILFTPSGTKDVSASYTEYNDDIQSVTMALGTIVGLDFNLSAGSLVSSPSSLFEILGTGEQKVVNISLTNSGAVAASFNLREHTAFISGKSASMPLANLSSGSSKGKGVWLYVEDIEEKYRRSFEQIDPLAANSENTGKTAARAYQWIPDNPRAFTSILVYADDPFHVPPNTLVDQALKSLGLGYTAHYDGDFAGFEASLTGGIWNLVIVANDQLSPLPSTKTALNNYVASGGRLIFHSWTVSADLGNDLWTTLGFNWIANDTSPPDPVYWWEAVHPVFRDPEGVPEFTDLDAVGFGVYGQYVEPLAGFRALAGYSTPRPNVDKAVLIAGKQASGNCTVFRGFLDAQNNANLDGDGFLDGVELWINLITGIEYCFFEDIPWLSESLTSGSIDAGSSTAVDVTFNSGSLSTGTYQGTLLVSENTPYPMLTIPVTMMVTDKPIFTLTVNKSGFGTGTVTSIPDGILCGSDCINDYAEGTVVILKAEASAGSVFKGWTGASCVGTGDCTITIDAAENVTATFGTPETLTVTKDGSGTGVVVTVPDGISCGTTCTYDFADETLVTLIASAYTGSVFTGWSGDCTGTDPCQVMMDTAKNVNATFALAQTLTVTTDGTGTGTVISSPAGISCETGDIGCTADFAENTFVTLTPIPDADSAFVEWSGACTGSDTCEVTMDAAKTVNAAFTLGNNLTTAKDGSGNGTITSNPEGIACEADCENTFLSGTVVTLTATPEPGSVFVGWSDPACSGTDPCAVTMDTDKTVTATFVLTYTLTVIKDGDGDGTVTSNPSGIDCGTTCAGDFQGNPVVTLTATPEPGSVFIGWSDPACIGTDPCVVTVDQVKTVNASFMLSGGTIGTVFTITDVEPGEKKTPKVYLGDEGIGKWKRIKVLVLDASAQTIKCLVNKYNKKIPVNTPVDIKIITRPDKNETILQDSFTYLSPQIQDVQPNIGAAMESIVVTGRFFGDKKARPKIYLNSGSVEKKCKVTDAKWDSVTGESQFTCRVHKKFVSGNVLSVRVANKIGGDEMQDVFTVQ